MDAVMNILCIMMGLVLGVLFTVIKQSPAIDTMHKKIGRLQGENAILIGGVDIELLADKLLSRIYIKMITFGDLTQLISLRTIVNKQIRKLRDKKRYNRSKK